MPVCYRGLGLMPFVYLAHGQAAAASARADVCVLTPACSSPANQSRLHSAISLPTAHHTTPNQSSHLLKISRTWQQRRLPTYKISSKLLACGARKERRKILEKVTLVSLSSLASDIFYICYPCLLFMLEYVFMEGGFIRLCVLGSSQGPLICLDQIKVVRDDKSCLVPALNHQLETPSFAVARQLCQRSIVRLCGSTFSPKLWQKVQTPDWLRLGSL